VERTACAASQDFPPGEFGLATRCVRENGQVSVKRGIPSLDARQRNVGQFQGRDFLSPQQPRGLLDGQKC
jgi:hypothetical protein